MGQPISSKAKTIQLFTVKIVHVTVQLVRCGGGEGCCGHRSFEFFQMCMLMLPYKICFRVLKHTFGQLCAVEQC